MPQIPLLVITGPTASGKSALALALAHRLHGEIISADSAQVYRGLDIGTAKPTATEQACIKHHLIDIRDPDQPYNVAMYQADVGRLIPDIIQRGKLPILVGGTGLYIRSIIAQYQFTETPSTQQRSALYEWSRQAGSQTVHRYLALIDPVAAKRIHPNDTRRLVRAWEKVLGNDDAAMLQPHDQQQHPAASPYRPYMLALHVERAALYRRINRRINQQLALGWAQEVRQLIAAISADAPAWDILGYRELKAYVTGQQSLDASVYIIKRQTRHFARRQLIWFRREKIDEWLDVTGGLTTMQIDTLTQRIAFICNVDMPL